MKKLLIIVFLSIFSNAGLLSIAIKGGKIIGKKNSTKKFTTNITKVSKIPLKTFVRNIDYYYSQSYKKLVNNLNKKSIKKSQQTFNNIKTTLKDILRNKRSSNYRQVALSVTKSKKGGWVKDPYSDAYCRLKDMEADHIFPISWGGSNASWNLVMACRKSNRSKKDKIDYRIIQGYMYKLQQNLPFNTF